MARKVFSLRIRTLLFLILIFCVSSVGAYWMHTFSEKLSRSSEKLRTQLMPTRRLLEQSRTEMDVQIHELELLTPNESKDNKSAKIMHASIPLGSATRALESLKGTPLLPASMQNLFAPWYRSLEEFRLNTQADSPNSQALTSSLRELREKTEILSRSIDREVSMQFLSLSSTSKTYGDFWALALGALLVLIVVFTCLLWRWTSPLLKMRDWLERQQHANLDSSIEVLPPRSVVGTGLLSPPLEVQVLSASLTGFFQRFQHQTKVLESREDKIRDAESATQTLYSALLHLMRHNGELFQELLKKERLASMSEMAAQLAHEIRNPLNSMNLKLELLREDLKPGEQRQLDAILGEIDRLDALTESHLRTTKMHLSLNAPDDNFSTVNQSLRDTVEMLEPDLKNRAVELSWDLGEEIWCPIPTSILRAVLINLIKNAWEAVDISATKKILIRTRSNAMDGDSWKLEIFDSGIGLPETLKTQSPEAFFTTKSGGSGLGLVTSVKMLAAYGTYIEFNESSAVPYRTVVTVKGVKCAPNPTTMDIVETQL